MVTNQDEKAPAEAEKPMDTKKYIVIKNHVREFTQKKKLKDLKINNEKCTDRISQKRKQKSRVQNPSLIEINDISESNISKTDLEELRTVYNKCKTVLTKIELKYGHLLQLENDTTGKRKRDIDENECNCKLNKKIVFDDDGNQYIQNPVSDAHICVKKFQKHGQLRVFEESISIEQETDSVTLPDNLKELGEMLKDLKISANLRRKIISKIKSIRLEHLNIMKMEKPFLIETMKSNSDELINFEGTNLSSLIGYLSSK